MTYNNIINHLKLWCLRKAESYQKAYGGYGGLASVACLLAYELEFKLSTLIDKSFENIEDLKSAVLDNLDVHYEPCLSQPQNSSAKNMIEKTNQEFCHFFEELLSKNEDLTLADVPYTRAIVGSEADALQGRFRSVWGYENSSYWFPHMGDEPKEISEKCFIMLKYFKPYIKQLEEMLGLPETHIYCYGESNFRPQNCIETVEIVEYGGLETIYTDKEFSWAIYFSHENTVAFAGAIVPKIKALLSKEEEHWDKFEWCLAE